MRSEIQMVVDNWVGGRNKEGDIDAMTRAMVVFKDGTYLGSKNNNCHAGMNYICSEKVMGQYGIRQYQPTEQTRQIKYAVSGLQRGQSVNVPPELRLRFIDYLINISPFAPFFMSSDPRQVIKDGCFIGYASAPSNVLMSGLIATRTLWEFHIMVYVWAALVDAGVDPNIAYVVAMASEASTTDWKNGHRAASTYLYKGGGKEHIEVYLGGQSEKMGHYPFQPAEFSIKSLKNYCEGKFINVNEPYNVNDNYYGTSKLFQTIVEGTKPNQTEYTLDRKKDKTPKLCNIIKNNMPKAIKPNKKGGIFYKVANRIEMDRLPRVGRMRGGDSDKYVSLTTAVNSFVRCVMPKIQKELDKP